jgi:hypothetical protein
MIYRLLKRETVTKILLIRNYGHAYMSIVVDIDEKLMEKNPINIEWTKLSDEITKYLPVNSISTNVIDYCCKVYLYQKKRKWNWMDKVDCYLGVPEHIETEGELNKVKYKIFPLSLVYQIAQLSSNNLHFSLYFESKIENQVYVLHFNYETFAEHLSSFEHGLDNNLKFWVDKVTLKWKALIKKIKDRPYKYAELRINTQLSHFYHTVLKKNIKKNIIRTIIKENFDYSIGQDYGIWEHLKKRGDFEDIVESFNYLDIPTLYKMENYKDENDNEKNINSFQELFPTLLSFGAELVHYRLCTKIDFENDPSNFVIERELDFLDNIISNTKEKLLYKFGYVDFDE